MIERPRYLLGQQKAEGVQGWVQGRSTSFSEELLQFKVPTGDGAEPNVVGLATTSDNAIHVLTEKPSNL